MTFNDSVPLGIRKRVRVYFKSSERMDELEPQTVQSVITSPPYWNLKDYKHDEQIGFGESYEKYHERLNNVWQQCRQVLKPEGTMWVVIDKIIKLDEVVHIPYDIAKHCKRLGFFLQDIIVWNKPTSIAGMNPNNLVNKYESVLFLSKSRTVFKLHVPTDSNVVSAPDYTKDGKRLTDMWRIPVKAGSIRKTPAHEAPYPEELIRRIVLMSTDVDDVILDPFLGSGTTLKVALELRRRCVGYEINPDFSEAIAEHLKEIRPQEFMQKLTEFT